MTDAEPLPPVPVLAGVYARPVLILVACQDGMIDLRTKLEDAEAIDLLRSLADDIETGGFNHGLTAPPHKPPASERG